MTQGWPPPPSGDPIPTAGGGAPDGRGGSAPLTPPPGVTDPLQIAMWLKSLRDSGQLPPGTPVEIPGPVGGTTIVSVGDHAMLTREQGAAMREAILGALRQPGGLAALQAMQRSSSIMIGGVAGGGDVVQVMDRVLPSMTPAAFQSMGGLGRLLGATPGGGEAIRAHDPAFTEAGLLGEVNAILRAVLAAHAESRAELVSGLLTPQLHEREARQMQINALQGRRRVVEGLEVRSATIDECGAGPLGDHATVRFRLYGADRELDGRGKRVSGDRKPTEWHELWALGRPPGMTTAVAGTPCAHCGFPGGPGSPACAQCGQRVPGRWLAGGWFRLT